MMQKITGILPLFALFLGCATSTHIIIGTPRPKIDSSAVLLYTIAPPSSQEIAILNVESSGWTSQGEKDHAIAKLKKEAASLGANGVLLLQIGTDSSGTFATINPQTGTLLAVPAAYTSVQAKAIFVPIQ